MQKKRNAKKGSTKKPAKKKKSLAKSGLSGTFQIIGISFFFGFALFALVSVLEKISTSDAFQVDQIKWVGLQHLKEGDILKGNTELVGQNIFNLDIEAVHRRLMSNPRIKAVTVKKDFPNRILITVEEKQPAAARFETDVYSDGLVKEDATVSIIDAEGSVLQSGIAAQNFAALSLGLPRLLHFKEAAYAKALDLAAVLENRLGLFIDLSDPQNLLVYFTEGEDQKPVGLLHLGSAHFAERWARFLAIEDDLKLRGLLNWEIDLRFPAQVIVKDGAKQGPLASGQTSLTTYF